MLNINDKLDTSYINKYLINVLQSLPNEDKEFLNSVFAGYTMITEDQLAAALEERFSLSLRSMEINKKRLNQTFYFNRPSWQETGIISYEAGEYFLNISVVNPEKYFLVDDEESFIEIISVKDAAAATHGVFYIKEIINKLKIKIGIINKNDYFLFNKDEVVFKVFSRMIPDYLTFEDELADISNLYDNVKHDKIKQIFKKIPVAPESGKIIGEKDGFVLFLTSKNNLLQINKNDYSILPNSAIVNNIIKGQILTDNYEANDFTFHNYFPMEKYDLAAHSPVPTFYNTLNIKDAKNKETLDDELIRVAQPFVLQEETKLSHISIYFDNFSPFILKKCYLCYDKVNLLDNNGKKKYFLTNSGEVTVVDIISSTANKHLLECVVKTDSLFSNIIAGDYIIIAPENIYAADSVFNKNKGVFLIKDITGDEITFEVELPKNAILEVGGKVDIRFGKKINIIGNNKYEIENLNYENIALSAAHILKKNDYCVIQGGVLNNGQNNGLFEITKIEYEALTNKSVFSCLGADFNIFFDSLDNYDTTLYTEFLTSETEDNSIISQPMDFVQLGTNVFQEVSIDYAFSTNYNKGWVDFEFVNKRLLNKKNKYWLVFEIENKNDVGFVFSINKLIENDNVHEAAFNIKTKIKKNRYKNIWENVVINDAGVFPACLPIRFHDEKNVVNFPAGKIESYKIVIEADSVKGLTNNVKYFFAPEVLYKSRSVYDKFSAIVDCSFFYKYNSEHFKKASIAYLYWRLNCYKPKSFISFIYSMAGLPCADFQGVVYKITDFDGNEKGAVGFTKDFFIEIIQMSQSDYLNLKEKKIDIINFLTNESAEDKNKREIKKYIVPADSSSIVVKGQFVDYLEPLVFGMDVSVYGGTGNGGAPCTPYNSVIMDYRKCGPENASMILKSNNKHYITVAGERRLKTTGRCGYIIYDISNFPLSGYVNLITFFPGIIDFFGRDSVLNNFKNYNSCENKVITSGRLTNNGGILIPGGRTSAADREVEGGSIPSIGRDGQPTDFGDIENNNDQVFNDVVDIPEEFFIGDLKYCSYHPEFKSTEWFWPEISPITKKSIPGQWGTFPEDGLAHPMWDGFMAPCYFAYPYLYDKKRVISPLKDMGGVIPYLQILLDGQNYQDRWLYLK